MGIQIITGKKDAKLKAVIYGPEGIGKSTLASRFPVPLFVDVEGGTNELDTARTQKPQSWSELLQILETLNGDMAGYQTLVIDTADWAEKLCKEQVCAEAGVKALGDKDYGALYQRVGAHWSRLLDLLSRINEKANVVVLAHSQIVHCDIPEESGTYDRYELKLLNSFKVNLAAMTKEWASLVLFVSYQTIIVDGKGQGGGKRVIHTSHHACWDAKQRTGFNLPETMDLPADRLPDALAKLVSGAAKPTPAAVPAKKEEPKAAIPSATAEAKTPPAASTAEKPADKPPADPEKDKLVEQLKTLMKGAGVRLADLQAYMAFRGVCTPDQTPRQYNMATLTKIVASWGETSQNIINFKNKAA